MRMMRTIATLSSHLSRTWSVHLSKRPLTASLLLQPKFLHLPVGQPLWYWMRIERYRRCLSTVRMGMVVRFMITIATPGCPFRQKCQSLRATQPRISHFPSLQSFLHQLVIHKTLKTQHHRLLKRSHLHPRPPNLGKCLSLRRFKPRGLFHPRSS
jgi:hypothetical protein